MKQTDEEKRELVDRTIRGLTNHSPSPDQVRRIEYVREAGKNLAGEIIACTDQSRDQSLALTALEDCVMRAVRSIVLEEGEE